MTIRPSLARLRPILFAAVLCAVSSPARAAEVEGIDFPENLKSGEAGLVLNGTAIRTKWGFNVYVAGLYLAERTQDDDAIMKQDRRGKRVQIAMLREVSTEKFEASIQESIEGNFSDTERQRFEAELKAFLGCFASGSSLKKSSVVNIDFIPEQGTVVSVDGHCHDLIPGEDFYHTLLRLWIGKPTQESMKPGLLGKAD